MNVLWLWYLSFKIISVLVVLRLSTLSIVLVFISVAGVCVKVDCLLRMIVLWLGVERICRLCLQMLFRDFLSLRNSSHIIGWYIFCFWYYVAVYCITIFLYVSSCRMNGPFTKYWFVDGDADGLQLLLWMWDTYLWLSRAVYILVLGLVVYWSWLGAILFGRFVSIGVTVDTSFKMSCFDRDSSFSLAFIGPEEWIFTNDWDCCPWCSELGRMLRDKSIWLLIGSIYDSSWSFGLLVIEISEVV